MQHTPDALSQRRAQLSEAKRRLLEQRLQGQTNPTTSQTLAPADPLEVPQIVPDPARLHEPFPLTDLQQAYWIGQTDLFALGAIVGHVYEEVELPIATLDVERLNAVMQQLIARHSVLRMVIHADGLQQILPEVPPFTLPVADLRAMEPEEREAHLATVRQQLTEQGLSTDRWPLFQFCAHYLPGNRLRLHGTLPLIIADGWSYHRLVAEFGMLYADPNQTLAPLSLSYRDYVLALHRLPSTAAYARDLAYWQARAAALPPPPPLPLQQQPTSLAQPSFVRRQGRLPAADWQRLQQRAGRAGLTDNALLLAIYAEVLSTWSQDLHYTINLVLSQRLPLHPEVNLLLGNCTSTLPLEVDHRTGADFLSRARQIQRQLWQDLDHALVSGVTIGREQARLQGGTNQLGAAVVFASTLDIGESGAALPDVQSVYSSQQTPQIYFDHQVSTDVGTGDLTYNWDVVEVLFFPGVVAAMFDAYSNLLGRLASDETLWTAPDLGLVPQADLAVRAARNAAVCIPLPRDLLYTPLLAQAQARPAALAVITPHQRLDYATLVRSATRLAHTLQQHGAAPNTLVAVVFPKGWEQVVAVLAIQLAGAAYLPLDPQLPPARREALLAHAQVRLVVTSPALAAVPWPDGLICLEVDENVMREADTPLPLPSSTVQPDDLAYVIYTSGSTGLPKGVMMSHRAARTTIDDLNVRFVLGPTDRVLSLSALSFDLSVYDIFGVLGAGGALVLPDAALERDPLHWQALLEQERVTVWNSVPALLELLLDGLGSQVWQAPWLRLVLLSGDWIGLGLPARARARLPQAQLISLGGATEAAIWSIWYPIGQVASSWRSIPYGWPLSYQPWAVRDSRGQARPAHVVGELWIGGAGVAQGYWADAERTAAQFVTDADGQRWYRTGDLGRYGADGTLEIVGRVDFQVKVQGYRIELGEVEAALRRAAGVGEAVVVVREDRPGERRLVGYVVGPEASAALAAGTVQAYLRGQLPEYMVPTALVALATLPLTPNGKIDRRALPAPQQETRLSQPPRTPVEQLLAQIWFDLFGQPITSVDANFFQLGGHSLLATQLLVRLREAFERPLPLRLVFEYPTLQDLAAALTEALDAPRMPEVPQIAPDPAELHAPFPLTDLQQAYWIGQTDLFALGAIVGHVYEEIELPIATLDVERLNGVMQQLIARHSVLRMVIRADGTQQILAEVPPFSLPVTDLRATGPAEREAHLTAVREQLAGEGPATDRWPLFQLRAHYLPDNRLRLHVNIPLIIADGWSYRRFVTEFGQLYADPNQTLAPLALSYRDYVLALHRLPATPAYARDLAYWQARAATLPPPPQLPLQQQPTNMVQPSFARRTARLPAAAWQRLQQRAGRAGLTDNALLLAVYAEVLSTWSQEPHYTINLLQAQRLPLHPEVNLLLGNCSTTLPLEVDHRSGGDFLSRARQLQRQLWQDLDHALVSGVTIGREQARLQGGTDQLASAVVFTSVLHIGERDDQEGLPDVQSVFSSQQTSQVYLDYQVGIDSATGDLSYNWDAVEHLFFPGVLDAMFEAHHHLLERVAADDDVWAEVELGLVPQADLAVRAARNADVCIPPPSGLLYTPLLAQAQARPAALAVITPHQRLDYATLVRSATRLAHTLQQHGAAPNTLVAVVFPKGWEQVVAVLAIQLAGAAYLPLDPQLPPARREALLAHAQVRLVVTSPALAAVPWPDGLICLEVDENVMRDTDTPLPLPSSTVQPDDLAYVIYTSGSTGLPKGVMIAHRAARTTIDDLNVRFVLSADDRVLGLSALSFDLSVYDIFGVLGAGGALVLPDAALERDPLHWQALLEQERVTVWNSVPALLELLLDGLGSQVWQAPWLRLVLLSGDWIGLGLPARARARLPQAQLISLGGATEAAIWSIWYPIGQVERSWRSIPYGWPLSYQPWAVRDSRGQARPAHVVGELWIGGAGVAQGYWADAERTAAQFVTDADGQRWYRTGDLGRYGADGTLEIVGRVDFQVKVQGYRIELGEVEAALRRAAGVGEAVVVVREDRPGERRLVGYVTPARTQPTTPSEQPAAPPALVDNDPLSRLKFKLTHPGLREAHESQTRILLGLPELDPAATGAYTARRSYRTFANEPIPLEQLSQLLLCLRQAALPGVPLAKARYGSAGSLYPVQVYLYINPGRVVGLAGGAYYYHPIGHELILLAPGPILDYRLYQTWNHPIAETAGFALFLIGQLDAIAPVYGATARDFCMLEAGLITQLLEMSAPDQQIGLCQVGGFEAAPLQQIFGLSERHLYLHSLLGGRIDPAQALLPALVADSSNTGALIEVIRAEGGLVASAAPSAAQAHGSIEQSLDALRAYLRGQLPEYMVPTALVALEALPLTPNGKIDRRALPAPQQETRLSQPPRTPVEQLLAQIWFDLFGQPITSVDANFFQLGGHSLLATQLLVRLREAFERPLPLRLVFEYPTLQDLAAALTEALDAPRMPEVPQIEPDPAELHAPFPLTDLQQAYWIGQTDLFALGAIVGHVYEEIELPLATLDVERLNGVMQQLIARHSVLRMVIRADGTQQILGEVPPFSLPVADLRAMDPAERDALLGDIRQELAQEGPATDRWPLFQLRAHYLPDNRLRLHISVPLIIADGWSYRRFVTEFGQLYAAPSQTLAPLALSYRDYVLALHRLPATPAYARDLAYWQARATALPPPPQLPLQQQPTALAQARFVRRQGRLPAADWQRLQQRAGWAGLTDNALLMAAYAEVLSAWSQEPHYTLNLLLAQRLPLHPEVNLLLGNCSTTLPLEVDHRSGSDFLSRARQLQRQLWQDLDHGLVSGVTIGREQARLQGWTNQLAAPVVFASMLHMGKEQAEANELASQTVFSTLQTPQVYLDHQVGIDGATGDLTYNWDAIEQLFFPGVLDAMFAAYNSLLGRLANDEALWTAPDLGLVPQADLAVRAARNAAVCIPPPSGLLYAPLLAQAQARPAALAVITPHQRLDYATLVRSAARLAHTLQQHGAAPNTLVAVVFPKGWEQVVAVLAIQLAGAAYLPLDPQLPPARREALLAHAQVRLVLTSPALAAAPWPADVTCFPLDAAALQDTDTPASLPPAPTAQPDDLAYVIYTSGSTGLPKGVMMSHRAARTTIDDLNVRFVLSADDRVLGLSALSFDLSVYDIFGVLGAGGALVLPDAALERDPLHWQALLEQERVTVWNSVPALLELLLDGLGSQVWQAPWLRLVLLSGDWIGLGLPARARARLPQAQLISLGGATEAAIWSIWYPIGQVASSWRSIPYGWPLSYQPWAVRDSRGQARPAHVVGELWIGGAGVAQGYWADAERTAAQFVTDAEGQRWYRTGDLGRYGADGTLEIVGRVDFQVKVQGYRIELGEVEAALRRAAGVGEAVVVVREDRPGERRLVGYVVGPEASAALAAGTVQVYLRGQLPEYMVPTALVALATLPLTPNGKIDRRALPAPEAPSSQGEMVLSSAPRDTLEQQVVELWSQVLDTPVYDVESDFFALGGTSVSAVRLVSLLRQRYDAALPLSVVFELGTVARQADYLRTLPGYAAAEPGAPELLQAQPGPLDPSLF